MRSKGLGLGLVLVLSGAVPTAVAEVVPETWYDVHEQYSGEGMPGAGECREPRQIEEIEVAPGVRVRADIWADDYVPTYEDLVRVGFLPEDANSIREVECTWGAIKACWNSPDPAECCSKKRNG